MYNALKKLNKNLSFIYLFLLIIVSIFAITNIM